MTSLLLDMLIIGICVLGLWGGAVWVVEAATRIARRFGVSELIIGLTVVAVGTSAPEFAVTISAALENQADIAVGNVIGSNIFNLGFILGGVTLAYALSTSRALVYRDGVVMVGAALLLLPMLSDLHLARWEGLILLALLVAYLGFLIYRRVPLEEETPTGEFRWYEIPRLLIGLGLIVVSGHCLVETASNLARLMGVSEWVIGVTIVAAGTSAPELATSLVAVRHGRHGISAGNLVGSTIFNLLGVLGLAAIIRPLNVDPAAYSSLLAQLGLLAFAVILMRTGWKLSRREGASLIGINLIRWMADFVR
jgi:cation:H+ antiporter